MKNGSKYSKDIEPSPVFPLNETGMPTKKIDFEKIFINIDTDGGNSLVDHFHSKMTHRIDVINKVKNYLEE